MTKERRDEVILVALVVSVALHLVLMFFVKPEVMVHITHVGKRAQHHVSMQVDSRESAPNAAAIEDLLDLKPLRDAPNAGEVAMREPDLPVVSHTAQVPTPLAVEPSLPNPSAELSSFGQPLVHLGDEEPSKIDLPRFQVVKPAEMKVAPKVNPAAAIPRFEPPPPVSTGIADVSPVKTVATMARPRQLSHAPTMSFKPSKEVYERVDEQVVTAEKNAVRELVNAPDAVDLDRFADVSMKVERQGDWTYFRVGITPRRNLATMPKDVVVLLDASGSVGKDRMKSIRKAASDMLRGVTNTGDRFNLVAFRDRYSYAFRTWQDCTQASFDASDRWLSNLVAHGRTDVFSTIASVLTLPRDPKRPLIALIITDGDANAGVYETSEIISRFTKLNDGLISVYMYGIKSSANRPLIDMLTHANRGEGYVFEGWRWQAGNEIDDFSTRFRDPVLSDLRIVFPSTVPAQIYPALLRNLYRGERFEIYGRLPSSAKEVAFALRGLNAGAAHEGYFSLPIGGATNEKGIAERWQDEQTFASHLKANK